MKRICFVCTGNTCRSVMAERLLKKKLKDRNINDYTVESAGLCALSEPISPEAKQSLKKNGYNSRNRISKKLTPQMLNGKNTLFITMTKDQKNHVPAQKVICISEFGCGQDVADPFGSTQDYYDECFRQLDEYTSLILEKIIKITGDQKI